MRKIENHKEIAGHLEQAAKLHHDVARHQEDDYVDEAYLSILEAHDETLLALEAQKAILKEYSLER